MFNLRTRTTYQKMFAVMIDGGTIYWNSAKGYQRENVNHHHKDYVRGDVHINNMEVFWGHMKRSIKGTHKVISKAYLQ